MGSKVNSYLAPNTIAQLGPLSIDCIEACGWFVKEAFFCTINPIKMKAKVPNLSLSCTMDSIKALVFAFMCVVLQKHQLVEETCLKLATNELPTNLPI
jgi:hypothetical protein